jgi:predicted Zn-dependent protease
LERYAVGGGETRAIIGSLWMGTVRWARNRITTTTEDRDNRLILTRSINGAAVEVNFNEVNDAALVAALRRAERLIHLEDEHVDADAISRKDSPLRPRDEPVTFPKLFFDTTYQLNAARRAETARTLMQSATAAGMLSAGYVNVSARSFAYITSWGYTKYFQYTWAQYSVTVRDPKGTGSGWGGVDWPDWNRVDGVKLSQIALDKCLASRNPVRVEPGRYTTILEPQAVGDFIAPLMTDDAINRMANEIMSGAPFHKSGDNEPPTHRTIGYSRMGERVIDARLSISSDPNDPDLGFPPYVDFILNGGVAAYHPAVWIERGVLKNPSYDRSYAVKMLGQTTGLPNEGAFRMSVDGTTTSIDEMIATTQRGLLVTRFDNLQQLGSPALLCRGYTRDGVWFIENGKISHPAKNLMFTESILFALNNLEQVGVPQRIFRPMSDWKPMAFAFNPQPIIVPPMKIRDFSFTALSDAV